MSKNEETKEGTNLSEIYNEQITTPEFNVFQMPLDKFDEITIDNSSLEIHTICNELSEEISGIIQEPITISTISSTISQIWKNDELIVNYDDSMDSILTSTNSIAQSLICMPQLNIESLLSTANDYIIADVKSLSVGNFECLSQVLEECCSPFNSFELNGVEYSKAEILEEAETAVDELKEQQKISSAIRNDIEKHGDKIFSYLKKRHPKIYTVFIGCLIVLSIIELKEPIESINEFVSSIAEDAIIAVEDNENIFVVKEDKARIYEEASPYSNVLLTICYGDKVETIEEAKLWMKVVYTSDDVVFEGWIAKRNLMSYKDYKYHDDDLLSID